MTTRAEKQSRRRTPSAERQPRIKRARKKGWGAVDDTRPHGIVPPPLTFHALGYDRAVRLSTRSKYTPAVAKRLCERIMMKESLTAICEDQAMPNLRTVVSWLANPKMADFREMYYYARRIQAEMLVDEIIEIADETSSDWKPRYNRNGDFIDLVPDNEAIQRSRVRIDARKWFAAKMVPRIYGENLHTDHEVVGDLAELLKSAVNKDRGLPLRPTALGATYDAED